MVETSQEKQQHKIAKEGSSGSDRGYVEKLKGFVKSMGICMLTTMSDDGLRSRPMYNQQSEFDGKVMYFFTWRDCPKINEIHSNNHVNISYSNTISNTYISLSGIAELVDDTQKMKELWNETLKAWFPKGLNDPNLGLLKISLTGGEYWDSTSSNMVQLFGYAKAIITGKQYVPSGDEHKKVDLTGKV